VAHKENRRRIRGGLLAIAILSGMLTLVSAAPALAFSTGPHTEILDNAMTDQGFGEDATVLAENFNTFMDLYQGAGAVSNPYSGRGTSKLGRLLIQNLSAEDWSLSVIAAASRGHFDSAPDMMKEGLSPEGLMSSLGTTQGVAAEWDRLQRALWSCLNEARIQNYPLKAIECLGATSHEVQDFYAHTNWVEAMPGHGFAGSDGPGWQERGFGSYPTWFDVPGEVREQAMVYGDSTPGHSRTHGSWAADGNLNVLTGMNKDSPPRPYYLKAAITAFFATEQLFEAARSWLNDDAFWQSMQNWQATGAKAKELEEDRKGEFEVMLFSGRQYGYGEVTGGPGPSGPAGNLLELRNAVKDYFGDVHKTSFRSDFEHLIVRLANPRATGEVEPVPSSQDLQRRMEIVVMRVTKMASVGAFGLGDVWPDQADMFAESGIDGQSYHSDVIHGENEFTFGKPFTPFTNYKVIPRDTIEPEPVESIELEVKTSCQRWSGTDDDVNLRLGENLKFPLNKRGTNDFERCDDDTYSVGIDGAVRSGLRVGDIDRLAIEKSGDGLLGGSWKLGGVKLIVNGRQFYKNMDIDKWVQDGQLTWEARSFVARDPQGPKIPIWIQLADDDFSGSTYPDYNPFDPFSGGDDRGDVNPDDRRDVLSFAYLPGKEVVRTGTGGNKLGGRLGFGGDLASVTVSLETLIPELMNPLGTVAAAAAGSQPPPPAGKPDLVIRRLEEGKVTVENRGESAAGSFRLRAEGVNGNGEDTELFAGLAAGASETRALKAMPLCEATQATVDDLEQVDEVDESNNSARAPTGGGCPHSVVVPNVEGDSERFAQEEIRAADLIPITVPVPISLCDNLGLVLSQSPQSGVVVQSDTVVSLRVGVRDPTHPCR
jgi:hypothetical protein